MNFIKTDNFEIVANLNKPVHDLHYALYPEFFNEYNYEKMKKTFKELMKNEKFSFILLEDLNEFIGYAWIEYKEYLENPFRKGYHSVYIHQINIQQTQRKKGYGTGLLNYIYSLAKERNIHTIELDYWVKNSIAKAFYDKHHFIKYREFGYKMI